MNAGHPSEEAIFNVARKLSDPEARADYLAQVCGDDAPLRARVEQLLAAREHHPDFLSTPHNTPSDSLPETAAFRVSPEGPGSTIGPYKLLEQLNEGGFGVVYVADQERPVRRRVALKVLKPGLDTRDIIARFEAEENALALMNHPNIAKVFDAGSTASGRPYFVMELVPGGLTLTDYCDRHNLPVEDRLRLFQDVCHAVHHAHQRGILHRDLKPGNVLVAVQDGRPVVKVIDFGIAKALHGQRLTDRTAYTRRGMLLGTPAYMSPEQADSECQDIDTRTDVWSLGVILYELLTGTTPIDGKRLRSVDQVEMARILKEEPPARPSTRIATLGATATDISAHRGTDPRHLSTTLRGDLDRVILKALEKDREHRYDSASALAADVGRYLDHQPVQATPPSVTYRLRKFAYRNRRVLAVAGAAALVLAVVGVTLAAGWWRDHQRALARAAVPQVRGLIAAEEYVEAWKMAHDARRWLPNDPLLEELWQQATAEVAIRSDPPGAAVSLRDWRADAAPVSLGRTPLEAVRVPRGPLVWQAALAGHAPQEFLATLKDQGKLALTLDPTAAVPRGMVHVHDQNSGLNFFLDGTEVTNQEFRAFVAAGGYANPDYWQELTQEGKDNWQTLLAEFVDSSRKPGPATWSDGTFPPGQDDHPVAGVSWYEAAAYARFAGKELPTITHWEFAAGLNDKTTLLLLSNFANAGTVPAGRSQAVSRFGARDMAGNVKEWVFNACEDSTHFALGGAYNDPPYLFTIRDRIRPWLRPSNTGFRCVKYVTAPTTAERCVMPGPARPGAIVPLDPQELTAVRKLVEYDQNAPLSPQLLKADILPGLGTHEVVVVNAAYGGERLTLHLYLPLGTTSPFQTVVYFPGVYARQFAAFDVGTTGPYAGDFARVSALLRAGRAFCYPIYSGTYERRLRTGALPEREWHVRMIQDLSRAVDYLATRSETFDRNALVYIGFSWGGHLGPMLAALEPRLRGCILVDGGTQLRRTREISDACFAAHLPGPVLMINGRDDALFPYATSQLPLFQAIGTPDKEHKVLPNLGHGVPVPVEMAHVIPWLDRRFGRPLDDSIPSDAPPEQLLLVERRIQAYGEAGLLDRADALTAELLRLREAHPDQPDDLFRARALAAELLCRRGRLDEGFRLFDGLIRERGDPRAQHAAQTAEAITRHATACRDLAFQFALPVDRPPGDYSQAARLAQRALAVQPACDSARRHLALARYRLGEFKASLEVLQDSARVDPPGVVHYLLFAMAHHRLGQRDVAQDFYAAAADWIVRDSLASKPVLDLNTEAQSELQLPPAMSTDPVGAEARILPKLPRGALSAKIHERLGNLTTAEADLTAALEVAPQRPWLHASRADLRLRLSRWMDAEADFTRVIDASPDDFWTRFKLAPLRLFLGDEDGCRALGNDLLSRWKDPNATKAACLLPVRNPDDFPRMRELLNGDFPSNFHLRWALQAQGMLDYRSGQWSRAVETLDRARSVNRGQAGSLDATALAFQAMAYHRQGDRDVAIKHLDEARSLVFRQAPRAGRGDFPDTWWDWLTAFEAYCEAASLVEGTDRAAVKAEMLSLLEAGRAEPARAATLLTVVLGRHPQSLPVLCERADAHARQRHWAEAARDLAGAHKAQPGDSFAGLRLAYLLQETDLPAYRGQCRALRQRFNNPAAWVEFIQGIEACVVQATPPEEAATLAAAADKALARASGPLIPHFQVAASLACLRAGQLDDAVRRLEVVRQAAPPNSSILGKALAALALARAHQGQGDKARECLTQLTALLADGFPGKSPEDLGPEWHNWLFCDILRREAEDVLKAAPAKPAPASTKDKPA